MGWRGHPFFLGRGGCGTGLDEIAVLADPARVFAAKGGKERRDAGVLCLQTLDLDNPCFVRQQGAGTLKDGDFVSFDIDFQTITSVGPKKAV